MYKQLPLIVELMLFTGYKDEAETLFCLSFELSRDFGLCYNMITLTDPSLIIRACSNGDYYKTVKNLAEFYKLFTHWHIDGGGGRYEYMKERVVKSANVNDTGGPMLMALQEGNYEIYKYLSGEMLKDTGYSLHLEDTVSYGVDYANWYFTSCEYGLWHYIEE